MACDLWALPVGLVLCTCHQWGPRPEGCLAYRVRESLLDAFGHVSLDPLGDGRLGLGVGGVGSVGGHGAGDGSLDRSEGWLDRSERWLDRTEHDEEGEWAGVVLYTCSVSRRS